MANNAAPGAATLCSPFVDALSITGASISVFGVHGRQSTICATDSISARAEALQFELGEGPHWQALAERTPVLCPDLAKGGTAWPVFLVAARGLGIGALFAFPMIMGAAIVGVVDLYRTKPGAMDAALVSRATSMASRVAGAAVHEATRSANSEHSEEREMAPALRREVHQATGMILAQLDTTATEALSRLRAHAFGAGRTVQEVAHDVVQRALDFSNLPD